LLVDTAGYHEMQNPISIDLSHLFLLLCTSQCFCRCGHCPQKHSEIMQEKKKNICTTQKKKRTLLLNTTLFFLRCSPYLLEKSNKFTHEVPKYPARQGVESSSERHAAKQKNDVSGSQVCWGIKYTCNERSVSSE